MSVLFIHPPLQNEVSGGNIFNRHIIHQALASGYPLASIPINQSQRTATLFSEIVGVQPRILIWDSFFFDFIAKHSPTFPAIRTAWLVHYLPSLNPGLDPLSATRQKLLETGAIGTSERLICTGSAMFRVLSARYPDKAVFLCRPGVEEFFRAIGNTVPKAGNLANIDLISVANLLPDKGYPELIEALSNLKDQQWTWHIVGSDRVDRSFNKSFRSCALTMKLMPRIHFHGVLSQKRLAKLFSKMDLLVQASRYESYGMAVAEAVAAGLPVVSTRTGAATELIRDGYSGFLVPVNDPGALQSVLEKLIGDPRLLDSFRRNSRDRPRLSWKSCFEDFKQACDCNP